MQTIFVVVALTILAGLGHAQEMPKPGVCGVSAIQPKPPSRIVNGEAVIPHSRPYQVLVVGFFPNGTAKYYCGGSIITSTHILTAAHCVVGNAPKDIRIIAGIHDFTTSLLTTANGIPAKQFFSHEKYGDKTLSNDVAVIRLQVPLTVDNIKVGLICLGDQPTDVCPNGQSVVASGWGSTTGDPNRPPSSRPSELQQVVLQCVDDTNAECKKLSWTTIFGIPISKDTSKMCAFAQKKGVCFGDSGGPLVRQRTHTDGTKYLEQVGIMSGTIDCSFTVARPDVYANIRTLHPWILSKVKASP